VIVLQTPNRILPAEESRFPHLPIYAAAVRDLAHRLEAVLVDHHSDWEPPERAGTITYWLHDAIHPNAVGHRVLARSLCRRLDMWDPASASGRLFIT
jgi:hypothetical protein